MKRQPIVAVVLASLAGLCAGANAQSLPPLEAGPKLVDAVQKADGQIEMRDAATGALLMAPRGVPLWDNKFDPTGLKPTITFQAQPAGFDLLYTFTNSTSTPKPPAMARLGIFTLGSDVTYHDFRFASEEVAANVVTFKTKSQTYPKQIYSPVWVIKNQTHALGVSIQYPIMDYKHDVRYSFNSPGGKLAEGEGGRGWQIEQRLANVGNEPANTELLYSASIAPGKSQHYVVSVRVSDPSEWVRTLVPYRDYFHSLYGGVKYTRDPRPIRASAIASEPLITATNPMGFGHEKLRPDTNGWAPWVKRLKAPKGWAGVILWNPTGMYYHNQDNNFPFQFTTNWLSTPKLSEAVDPAKGLPSVAAAGTPLGLWWGRSNQVADVWDDATLENLDPENSKHRALAFAELDLAAKTGATIIGLDTFSHRNVPIWKLYPWLQTMQARHPQVRFAQEPICSDVMHTVGASFFRAFDDAEKPSSVSDIMRVNSPHLLADFINPGHEIWGGFRYTGHKQFFGVEPTQQMVLDDAKRLAGFGYVPVLFTDFDMVPGIVAAESWNFTVPSDLRPDSGGSSGGSASGPSTSAKQASASAPKKITFSKKNNRRLSTGVRDTSSAAERAKIANADQPDQ